MYLRLFRKNLYEIYVDERRFYKEIFSDLPPMVFDIGANVGDKSALFSKLKCKVVAFEPDRDNYSLLRKRFFLNWKVKIINAALGSHSGTHLFYVNASGSPANTLSKKWKDVLEDPSKNRWSKKLSFESSYEVEVITLEEAIKLYGVPSFIKIDVEGYELEVLKGLDSKISIISLEANFPEFKDETLECIDQLVACLGEAKFNCIDSQFKFFWENHISAEEIKNWMKKTDLRYFELFCFNQPGIERRII